MAKVKASAAPAEAKAKAKRPALKGKPAEDIIAECHRVCAMCYCLENDGTHKYGQLAHLDQDRTNNNPQNLAYLCLAHHDEYDTVRRQTRNYTAGEIRRYKAEVLKAVKAKLIPVSYTKGGASLRIRGRLGLATISDKFKRAPVGATLYLPVRVSNCGSVTTGIEAVRFYFGEEIVADESWDILFIGDEHDNVSRPDRKIFPVGSRYLTCQTDQMFESGRVYHMVIPLTVRTDSDLMAHIRLLWQDVGRHHVDLPQPAMLELRPVIGPPVATEITRLQKYQAFDKDRNPKEKLLDALSND